jgi:transcriptional regulatory protein RtcR
MTRKSANKPLVGVGILGTVLDGGMGRKRWDRWRPTVDLARHEDLPFDRYHLLFQEKFRELGEVVAADLRHLRPGMEVVCEVLPAHDPWDFEAVYSVLLDLSRRLAVDPSREDLLVHITTGSHVHQICLFLLTEARFLPGRLLQTSPPEGTDKSLPGRASLIDLDLSRYDRIASRFREDIRDRRDFLKDGIRTRDKAFNRLIERIEVVASRSRDPILLGGPTGSGKSSLARRIHELRRQRGLVAGEFVAVNCATLAGEGAMSALFGHVKGAFTGAVGDRGGYLRAADQGILFLDEIGELGLEEQAMLLVALEEKRFRPVGSDREVASDFLLLAGSHKDLGAEVARGRFREDLLARLQLWTFVLPGLAERPSDLEPNLEYELERLRGREGRQVSITREARERFLEWGASERALWRGNFRDLSAAVSRMALLSDGRITKPQVDEEIERLERSWIRTGESVTESVVPSRVGRLDEFDRVQLAHVLGVCRSSATMADAGRRLFSVSRERKESPNDSDRLRKYLGRFGLSWSEAHESSSPGHR